MKDSTQLAIIVGGAAAVAFVLYKAVPKVAAAAGGLVTGYNPATRNATNAAGERVTAYEGAGLLGTAGAVANAASGGYLATFGQWIGGKTYDMFNTDPMASVDRYNRPPSTSSGANYDETDRLLARYPAPRSPTEPQYDAMGNYLGVW